MSESTMLADSAAPRGRRLLGIAARIGGYAVMAVVALAVLYPIFFAINTSLKDLTDYGQHTFGIVRNPTLENFSYVLGQANVWGGLRNTFLVALGAILLLWICGAMAGYAVAKLRFRGRVLFFLVVLASGLVPFQTIVAPIYQELLQFGLLDTYRGLILVFVGFGMPVTAFIFAAYFQGLPDSLIEAARLDGASTLRILLRVILPMARPALAITGILNFVMVFNDLLTPLIVMQTDDKQLFVVGIAQALGRFPRPTWQAAGVVVGLLPLTITFLFAQRYLVRGITTGAVR